MESLLVSSLSLDKITKIALEKNEVTDIPLNSNSGPYKLYYYDKKVISVNYYSGGISKINLQTNKEEYIIYTGKGPTDIKVLNNEAYIPCSDSNCLSIVDLNQGALVMSIPLGINPCSIEISKNNAYITNLEEGSISIIDCDTKKEKDSIKGIEYPSKIISSKNDSVIYVCESNISCDKCGNINIYSLNNHLLEGKIRVGKAPVDMCLSSGLLYVSNFGESSISIIDLKSQKEISKIYLDISPRPIVRYQKDIYIGDFLGGGIYKIEIESETIKKIALSSQPSAIIVI